MRKRATAIIREGDSILLFRRIKDGREYYIFPGGGVDNGETEERALQREVTEETTLAVQSARLLFTVPVKVPEFITIHTGDRTEFVFLVEEYSGKPELSGPEKECSGPLNQYHLEWIPISQLVTLANLHPQEVVQRLLSHIEKL